MTVWIGIAVALMLLFVGLAGLAVGLLLVLQQLNRRRINLNHRAKKLEELHQLPHRTTQVLQASQRPTMPLISAPGGAGLGEHPPFSPEDEPDVPTGVFRASDYKDIDSLVAHADQYVQKKKKK